MSLFIFCRYLWSTPLVWTPHHWREHHTTGVNTTPLVTPVVTSHHWCYLLYCTKSRFWNLQSSNFVNFFELTNCKITKTLSYLGLQLGGMTALGDLPEVSFLQNLHEKRVFFPAEGNTFVLVNWKESRRHVSQTKAKHRVLKIKVCSKIVSGFSSQNARLFRSKMRRTFLYSSKGVGGGGRV